MTHEAPALPIGEAAKRLGVSVGTLRRWADLGEVASVRTPGKQRRFPAAEIDRLTILWSTQGETTGSETGGELGPHAPKPTPSSPPPPA